MQLVVFDLDGTLTRTTRVDERCFVAALREELGIVEVDSDWAQYTYSTDSGISAEIFQKRLGRAPTHAELRRLEQRFVRLLAAAFESDPASCTAVAGASAALRRLRTDPQWRVALATGSWRASATLKLATAGLDLGGVPAAFADDNVRREDIIALARARARERAPGGEFSRVVYVGDAPWDVRAARRLNIPFVGIAGARAAARLRAEGAGAILRDFSEVEQLIEALQRAPAPSAD